MRTINVMIATTVPNLPISSATDSSFYCNGVGGFSISNNFFIWLAYVDSPTASTSIYP